MTSIRHSTGCRFACALAACALIGLVQPAFGVDQLPEDVATAAQLSTGQEQQVQEFVRAQFARLTSDDPEVVEDARRSLESPFTDRQAPSIAFRLAYGSQVAIELGPILRATDPDTTAAINALLVAGQCGTPQTVELLGDVVSGKRGKASAAVRAAAIAGLHSVIRDADSGRVRREQGEQAVTYVAQALATTDDASFATTCIVALNATDRQMLHAKPAEQLADALPTLAASIRNNPSLTQPQRWEQVLQLGIQLIYVYILQAKSTGQLDANVTKGSVEAGAQALGFVVARVEDAGVEVLADTDEGARLVGLTERAENLMKLSGGSGFPGGLSAKLQQAIDQDDADMFIDAAKEAGEWIRRATGKAPDAFGL